MIQRWTLWESDEGEPLQMSLALLDDTWEPQMERTVPLGPFHDAEWGRLTLSDDARRWMRLYGIQLELGLGS